MSLDRFAKFRAGAVIPACPLALNRERQLDERRQRALIRYYAAAGAGGLAVGVHTTQFAIRNPQVGLFRPLLELAREEMERAESVRGSTFFRIGGVCGSTEQALSEAALLADLGYDAALLSLAALSDADVATLLEHCRQVSQVIPLVGFYLQPAVGGRVLPYAFWRKFCELERVVGIKIAPFNRYQTLDVLRAVSESGREDIALYTGNDDNIVADLTTPFSFRKDGPQQHILGGLLGQWAVWTRPAVELHRKCLATHGNASVPASLLRCGIQLTDANAALFDAANGFAGCIAGLHEILRRQGLLEGLWLLDPDEGLSPGQLAEIERVCAAYPHLTDDPFVVERRDEWLRG
jgi:dihydrodipicolinate synthase/N-acetylneuraminate lyase